jgi:transposase-like protein
MAKRKRKRYGDMRSSLSKEEKQRIINDYIEATGKDEIDMNEVARWADAQGKRIPDHLNYW